MQLTKHLSWLVMGVIWAAGPGVAYADATVMVELKGEGGAPADGRVELVKGEARHSCTTVQGRCEIRGVAGGMYSVQVSGTKQAAPKAKQAMIPPSGEVKLVVNAS